jgi:hypothetical protein
MKRLKGIATFLIGGWFVLSTVAISAQAAPIIYPAGGQSPEQQSKDEGECHQWAVKNTGVDPAQLAAEASRGEPSQQNSTVVGGAARGALAGVAIGAIAGDAGKGAAIGATAGGVGGGVRGRRQANSQQQVADNRRAQQQASLQEYERAYSACLTGKGYTVQ